MLRTPIPGRSRRARGVAALGVAVALAGGAAVVATHAGAHDHAGLTSDQTAPPGETSSAGSRTAGANTAAPSPTPTDAPSLDTVAPNGELLQVPASRDPVAFASSVAHALFTWDTTSPAPLAAYKGRLLAVADPTGTESPGLVADLATYLPSLDAWDLLRGYDTSQWLEVRSAAVPATWESAVSRTPGAVTPGTVAVTVDGVRHRAGVWDGGPVTSASDIAFTVFVVCAPTYPTCWLLRLTQPDKPLR